MSTDSRFTVPLYTLPLAAAHLDIPVRTLTNWTKKSDLLTVLPGHGREPRLPFIALVEAQFYRQLRSQGLSMQAITSGMSAVRAKYGDRMLEKDVLAHDGKDILVNHADEGEPEWARARDQQGGLPKLIEIGLQPITYTNDNLPGRVRLTAYGDVDVIADPRYSFGQPVIDGTGVRVEDVLSLFRAGENLATITEEMGIGIDAAEAVVRRHLLAA